MLFIEMGKLEFDSPAAILILFYFRAVISRIRFPDDHIGIILFIEMAKIELTDDHIGIMLFIEISK